MFDGCNSRSLGAMLGVFFLLLVTAAGIAGTPTPTPTPTPSGGVIFTGSTDAILAQGNATNVVTRNPTGFQLSGGTPTITTALAALTDLGPASIASELGAGDFTASIDMDPASANLQPSNNVNYTAYGISFLLDSGTSFVSIGWIDLSATDGGLYPYIFEAPAAGSPYQFRAATNALGTSARLTVTRVGDVATLYDSRSGLIGSVNLPTGAVVSKIGFFAYTNNGPIPAGSGKMGMFILTSNSIQTNINFDPNVPTPTPIPTPPPTPTPTPPPDFDAPIILAGPSISSITNTTALVSWTTNEAATSGVHYGPGSPSLTVNDPTLVFDHQVLLTGLTPDTVYAANVFSTDGFGNGPTTSAPDVPFRTNASDDVTPPVLVSQPFVSSITTNSANVSWTTDEASTSEVDYGPTLGLGSTSAVPGLTTAHSADLTGLSPGTKYFFQTQSIDPAGNAGVSLTLNFTTLSVPDNSPPVIVAGPGSGAVRETTVYVGWTTNEPANSVIRYNDGTTFRVFTNDSLRIGHLFQLCNLTPGTTYTYTVESVDGSGNGPTVGAPLTFTTTTVPDTQHPVLTEGPYLGAVTDQTATVSWKTDEPATTVIFFNLKSDPHTVFSVFDAVADLSDVIDHQIAMVNLASDTDFKYQIVSVDPAGNELVGPLRFVRTLPVPDSLPPVYLIEPDLVGTTDTTASFFWVTDEPSSTRIEYGPNPPGTFTLLREDPTLVTIHRMTLVDLTPGQSYDFRISSADASGNRAFAGAGSPGISAPAQAFHGFATNTLPDTTPPNITSGPDVVAISDGSATIHWTTDEIADSRVIYRLFGGLAFFPEVDDFSRDTDHLVVVTGLSPSTNYTFNVASIDVAGNRSDSSDMDFSTTAGPDTDAPVITQEPGASEIKLDRATITWQTDEFTLSGVEFGTESHDLGHQMNRAGQRSDHSVTLTNLDPGTTYYYRTVSTDIAGNQTRSALHQLITFGVFNQASRWQMYE